MLSPEKLAFSRVLSRDLGLWCVLTSNTKGNYWKSGRLHCPLPNSRCGPASHFGVKKTLPNSLKNTRQCRSNEKRFFSSLTRLTDQSSTAVVNQKQLQTGRNNK